MLSIDLIGLYQITKDQTPDVFPNNQPTIHISLDHSSYPVSV